MQQSTAALVSPGPLSFWETLGVLCPGPRIGASRPRTGAEALGKSQQSASEDGSGPLHGPCSAGPAAVRGCQAGGAGIVGACVRHACSTPCRQHVGCPASVGVLCIPAAGLSASEGGPRNEHKRGSSPRRGRTRFRVEPNPTRRLRPGTADRGRQDAEPPEAPRRSRPGHWGPTPGLIAQT